VLAILVFGPLAMGAVDAWAFLVVQGLTMGVMLLWALRIWISPKPQLLWPPICWVVLAFTIYAIARYLTADIEYVARQEMIQVLLYAFLFFAIVNNLYRQEFSQVISFTLIFLAMGISATRSINFWRTRTTSGISPRPIRDARRALTFRRTTWRVSRNAFAAGRRLRFGGAHETGDADCCWATRRWSCWREWR
jgi:hypothetical protein